MIWVFLAGSAFPFVIGGIYWLSQWALDRYVR